MDAPEAVATAVARWNVGDLRTPAALKPKKGPAEQFWHKNRLQEYALKAAIPLPIYHTVNEGHTHAPQFKSSVTVDGLTFTSPNTFFHRKEAEQEVAKLAYESICKTIKDEGVPFISEETMLSTILKDNIFCKSILHEYTIKMDIERPTYSTTQSEGLLPVFTSSLIFDGEIYTGGPAKSKKDAEHMAARAAIETTLANSDLRAVMSEVIKSKGKLYAAIQKTKISATSVNNDIALMLQAEKTSSNRCNIDSKEVQTDVELDKIHLATPLSPPVVAQSCSPEYNNSNDEYPYEGIVGTDVEQCFQAWGSSSMVCNTSNNQASQGISLDGSFGQSHVTEDTAANVQRKRPSNRQKRWRDQKKIKFDHRTPTRYDPSGFFYDMPR